MQVAIQGGGGLADLKQCRRAIARSPANALLDERRRCGWDKELVRGIRQAVALVPLLAMTLQRLGRDDEAERTWQAADELARRQIRASATEARQMAAPWDRRLELELLLAQYQGTPR